MKRARICSVVLAGILTGTLGCSRASYLKRGEQAQAAGKYRTAEIFFRKEVQAYPRSVKAHYALAQILLLEGNSDFAYNELERASALDPNDEQTQVSLARLLLMANRTDEAERVVRGIQHAHPQSLDAGVLAADILIRRGELADARKQFQQVVKQHPDKAAGYVGIAQVCMSLGLGDEARQNLDLAIKAEPSATDAYVLKAKGQVAMGQTAQAVSTMRAAVAANPKSGDAMLVLGDALVENHNDNEAAALWRNMVANGPDQQLACARLVLHEVASNKVDQAAKDLALISADDFKTSDLVYATARLRLAQQRFAEAGKLLTELTHRNPHFAPAFYYLGAAEIGLGKSQDARNAFESAEQLAPNDFSTEEMLAGLTYNNHEFAEAIQHAQFAVALDPKNATARMLLGDALLADKRFDQAAEQYHVVLQLNPKSARGYERLGRVAMLENTHLDLGAAELNQALKLQPTFLMAAEDLTLVLWKSQGSKAALNRLRAQVELQPKASSPYFHALLGTYLARNSEYAEAESELRNAIKAQPTMLGAYLQLATAYEKDGQPEQVKAVLQAALKQKPDYVAALIEMGNIADQQEDRKQAIGYYQKVLAINPNIASVANNLAWDYAAQNENLAEALNLAQHARQLDPKNPNVADTLAAIMLKRGVPAAALPLLQESVSAEPNSVMLHYHLGLARLALNDPAKATSEFNTALKLNPSSTEAKQINTSLAEAQRDLRRNQTANNRSF